MALDEVTTSGPKTNNRPPQGDQRPQPAILNSHRLQLISSINLANHYAGYGGNLIFPRFAAWE